MPTKISKVVAIIISITKKLFSGFAGGVTPVPIPNTEVKLSKADGTPRVTARESR